MTDVRCTGHAVHPSVEARLRHPWRKTVRCIEHPPPPAERFDAADCGANLAICSRGKGVLDATRTQLDRLKMKTHTQVCDVSEPDGSKSRAE